MRIVPFKQVDVFTAEPFRGNPVAVIVDAEALDATAMQRIAAWTNLSETTFVLPPTQPGADYRVRIFTPRQELAFAGHPSVGTAHALLECGWTREHEHALTMECAAGVLPIAVEGEGAERRIFVRAPRPVYEEPDLTLAVATARALGTTVESSPPVRIARNGPSWVLAALRSGAQVRALRPDFARMIELSRDYGAVGVAAFAPDESGEFDVVVRAFAPIDGIPEDPVTGSANALIGDYLREYELLPGGRAEYRASQGREVGRDGRVVVRAGDDGEVWIGGASVTCVDGTIRL